jgi:hypothetical protein
MRRAARLSKPVEASVREGQDASFRGDLRGTPARVHAARVVRPKQPVKISDPAVFGAATRLDEYTKMLASRLRDYWAAQTRLDKTLAFIELEVAARLIHSGACELNMRLLPHGVRHEVEAEVKKRTAGLAEARLDHEARFGPVPTA